MSEFKVGGRVRITKKGTHCYEVGDVVELIGFHPSNRNQKWETESDIGWLYDGEFEAIPKPSPKTYTLTPYIKPETVTINGFEYIMTENV